MPLNNGRGEGRTAATVREQNDFAGWEQHWNETISYAVDEARDYAAIARVFEKYQQLCSLSTYGLDASASMSYIYRCLYLPAESASSKEIEEKRFGLVI